MTRLARGVRPTPLSVNLSKRSMRSGPPGPSVPAVIVGRSASIPRGAPRWTDDTNRRRPAEMADRDRAVPRGAVSGEVAVTDRPSTPSSGERDFAAANGWSDPYESFDDFDLPMYVGPVSFQKLPWVDDAAEIT